MKIPQHIINKADRIIKNVKENANLEKEIIAWIESKGVQLDQQSDVIACLMYAEYESGEKFAQTLSSAIDDGDII